MSKNGIAKTHNEAKHIYTPTDVNTHVLKYIHKLVYIYILNTSSLKYGHVFFLSSTFYWKWVSIEYNTINIYIVLCCVILYC